MRRLVLSLITGVTVLLGGTAAAAACPVQPPGTRAAHQIEAAVQATAKYHSVAKATKAGYSAFHDTAGIYCISEPGMGAMGIHYVDGALVGDSKINVRHPEALVYQPGAHGKRTLVALEYIVIKSNWDAAHAAPPRLFGQPFNFTDAPNRYGLPPFYSLHAWIWKSNPAGMFAMWNPRVHCP